MTAVRSRTRKKDRHVVYCSLNVIRVNESRIRVTELAGHVARIGDKIEHKAFGGET